MDETELTQEEKDLIKQINEAQNYGATGSTVGGAIGSGLGIAASAATLGGALPLVPAFTGIGSAIGGLFGGNMGQEKATAAEERLSKLQEARMKPFLEKQARRAALDKLLGRYNVYGV